MDFDLGNITEPIQDALQGDIEIAGKRIPKVALLAGGGVLIIVLILLSRRGSNRSLSSNGVLAGDSTGNGATSNLGGEGSSTSDQVTGDLISGSIQDAQATFEQMLADQATSLTDLISQNSASQAADFSSQLQGVYDALGSFTQVAPAYQDSYTPVPFDTGYSGFSIPIDTGYTSYGNEPSFSYGQTNVSVASGSTKEGKDKVPVIKPSSPKSGAKLGSALSRPSADKITKLGGAPKLSAEKGLLSAITNFNKKQPVKPANQVSGAVSLNAFTKQKPTIPSIPSNKQKPTNAPNASPKPSGKKPSGKKPVAIPATIKNTVLSGYSKTGQKQAAKPASIVQSKPVAKPVYVPPKPVYKPPVYTPPKIMLPSPSMNFNPYSTIFRSLPYGNASTKKISSTTYKKGR